MPFPTKGRSADDLLAELEARKANDVRWKEGRVFAYVYDAGPEAMETVKQAYSSFLTENGLDPTSFPSCLELERDVIAMALDLQNAPASAKGSFTTGGTESILLSVKTARDHARATKPHITAPELILPETAHPAFYKACKYFDVTPVVTPVDPDGFTALPDAMEKGHQRPDGNAGRVRALLRPRGCGSDCCHWPDRSEAWASVPCRLLRRGACICPLRASWARIFQTLTCRHRA